MPGDHAFEEFQQWSRLERLEHELVRSGRERVAAGVVEHVAGHGDQECRLQGRLVADGGADAEAIAAGHVDIAEDDLGEELFGQIEAFVAVAGGMDFPAALLEVGAQRFPQLGVVVDQ